MEHSILIVDNDIEQCRILFTIFERLNYDVAMACDPPKARSLLRHRLYDLALLDLHLGDAACDGIALFGQLSAVHPPLRGVLVTGDATPPVHREARLSGIASVVSKPVDFRCLIRIVERTLAAGSDMKHTTARFRGALTKQPSH